MQRKITMTLVIMSMALVVQGCATGYNRSLVVNKSNIGLDFETAPAKLETAISSSSGVITPTFEGGQTLPLMTNTSSESNHFSKFFFGRSSTISTGDAAYTLSYLYADCNRDVSPIRSIPDVLLSEKPDAIPGPGEVKPAVFMSNTVLGAKMSWSRSAAMIPSALNLGFKRKEELSTPITVTPDINNPSKLVAGTPSFIATVDHSNDLKRQKDGKAEVGAGYVQYFALGESANNLALRSDTRQALFHRFTPLMTDSFCEDDYETKTR